MINFVDSHGEEFERLVIFHDFNGKPVTVFSGTIEEWREQDTPYWYSSVYYDNSEGYGHTLFVEILDV